MGFVAEQLGFKSQLHQLLMRYLFELSLPIYRMGVLTAPYVVGTVGVPSFAQGMGGIKKHKAVLAYQKHTVHT